MSITTYAELKTAVANWLERADLTSRIPEFIVIAESSIASKLRAHYNEKRIIASISTQYFDKPENYQQMRNFQLNTDPIQHLNYVSPEQMDLYEPTATTGRPTVYSEHGTEFEVKPIPDATYMAEMTYWYRLTEFSGDTDTNKLLTNHPEVYLYGALAAAMPFLDKDSPNYEAMFQSKIKQLNDAEKFGRYSGTALYAKPRKVPE